MKDMLKLVMRLEQEAFGSYVHPPVIVSDEEIARRNRDRFTICPAGCRCQSCESRQ